MAQHDQIIDNGPGRSVRLDINAAVAALFSSSSGPVSPAVTVGGQPWFDTTDPVTPKLWIRDAANAAWLDLNKDFATDQYRGSPGDFTVTAANIGDFIQFTTAGTANLPSVASVVGRFWATISAQNGAVVIQPAPGENIDGGSSLTVPSGFTVELRNTGTEWRTSMVPVTLSKISTVIAQLPTVTPLVGDQIILLDSATGLMRGRASQQSIGNPPGTIITFGSPTPPTGYLTCNGAAISRTTYATLFASIATWWGTGDGSTTFNVPDFRGEFLRGFDGGRGVDVGRVFGSFQNEAFLSHGHSIYDPTHAHVAAGGYSFVVVVGGSGGQGDAGSGFSSVGSTDYRYTGIGVNAAGGNETRPRNKAPLFAIKF